MRGITTEFGRESDRFVPNSHAGHRQAVPVFGTRRELRQDILGRFGRVLPSWPREECRSLQLRTNLVGAMPGPSRQERRPIGLQSDRILPAGTTQRSPTDAGLVQGRRDRSSGILPIRHGPPHGQVLLQTSDEGCVHRAILASKQEEHAGNDRLDAVRQGRRETHPPRRRRSVACCHGTHRRRTTKNGGPSRAQLHHLQGRDSHPGRTIGGTTARQFGCHGMETDRR
mmetsp:Transcript_6740/g.19740  ORF Transcript_6740/g.19740 Transcript_6740/m.19740 type:complete len:227 (-) Transcript_6740:272-952(-)